MKTKLEILRNLGIAFQVGSCAKEIRIRTYPTGYSVAHFTKKALKELIDELTEKHNSMEDK
jgi:hypothetical protein